jgi:hypothetical protein
MQERKIPTLLGLLLVVGAVLIFRLAFDRVAPLLSQAETTIAPQNVLFTNISDTAFTVTWTTNEPTSGAAIVDGVNSDGTHIDDRDSLLTGSTPQNSQGSYITHSVTVRNLKPSTTYKVQLMSAGKLYLNDGNKYEITTGPHLESKSIPLEPAYGQITNADGSPAEGALVYVTLAGSQTLSTIVKSTGSWVIPLHLIRAKELSSFLPVSERIDESIIVRLGHEETTAETDTVNDNPVPAMTVGKTYDFRNIQADQNPHALAVIPPTTTLTPSHAPSPSAEPTAKPTSAPTPTKAVVLGTTSTKKAVISITKPAKGASLPTNLPLIQGTGVPGKQVLLVIGITQPTSSAVTISPDGTWRYTPPKPLTPGKQSITITTTDEQGKTVAISHGFEILKSGTQVLGDATPSGTLTITQAPTLIPTATPTQDIASSSPTPTVDLVGEPLPTSGNELPLLILVMVGTMMLLGGGVLLKVK